MSLTILQKVESSHDVLTSGPAMWLFGTTAKSNRFGNASRVLSCRLVLRRAGRKILVELTPYQTACSIGLACALL